MGAAGSRRSSGLRVETAGTGAAGTGAAGTDTAGPEHRDVPQQVRPVVVDEAGVRGRGVGSRAVVIDRVVASPVLCVGHRTGSFATLLQNPLGIGPWPRQTRRPGRL